MQAYEQTSDISFPHEQPRRYPSCPLAILGLNPGAPKVVRRPWHNFHTAGRHNDHFLAEAFRDTAYWGAHMTDLLSEVNSKSATLDLSDETIRRYVSVLVDQLQALEAVDPLFILIGAKTAKAFTDHAPVLADRLGLARVRPVAVPHYLAAYGRVHGNSPGKYRRFVLAALATADD
ncbi:MULTISPECIES: hypothetical protein [Arthrobacter]|uniref:Uracil-DNA glycosylase-like domain-containing protein n=1 Tax=Arthrobacter terricola TaxID=2547396 RepID=A0A4R5KBZ6_9MICC|nr:MULTISPECIES: hypothetical protein [Arthrobacter]MBT8162630.1 hypothetical protein [Arthrobacter sp. GN70]TDF92412.1 hypothetical protein E1809_17875 [Arthrobacter terricola]